MLRSFGRIGWRVAVGFALLYCVLHPRETWLYVACALGLYIAINEHLHYCRERRQGKWWFR